MPNGWGGWNSVPLAARANMPPPAGGVTQWSGGGGTAAEQGSGGDEAGSRESRMHTKLPVLRGGGVAGGSGTDVSPRSLWDKRESGEGEMGGGDLATHLVLGERLGFTPARRVSASRIALPRTPIPQTLDSIPHTLGPMPQTLDPMP